jgi:hypothetical protein
MLAVVGGPEDGLARRQGEKSSVYLYYSAAVLVWGWKYGSIVQLLNRAARTFHCGGYGG